MTKKKWAEMTLEEKAIYQTKKGLRAGGERLKTGSKTVDAAIQGLIDKAPAADAAILVMGFMAGLKGYTPMSALLKGLNLLPETAKAAVETIPAVTAGMVFNPFDPLSWLRGQAKAKKADPAYIPAANVLEWDDYLCMGCVGAIEAYCITRPGALGAVLGFIGQMAQATAEGIDALTPLT